MKPKSFNHLKSILVAYARYSDAEVAELKFSAIFVQTRGGGELIREHDPSAKMKISSDELYTQLLKGN